jgi:hypothetical protein
MTMSSLSHLLFYGLCTRMCAGLLTFAICATPAGRCKGDDDSRSSEAERQVKRAIEMLGLAGNPGVRASARLVSEPEQTIPNVTGEPTWRVRLAKAPLYYRSNGVLKTNEFIKAMELIFSAKTGQLLRLVSDSPENLPSGPFPSLKDYENGFWLTFKSISANPPKTSLLDVLGNTWAQMWSAKQIVVYYVLGQVRGTPPRPLWIVHVLGIPPAILSRPVPPQFQGRLTQKRVIIDAETGEELGSDGIPGL